ncbi:MAG: hypothetical protein AAGD25_26050 [Cyanobacteria bacterium P01_F01_bin.150]
MSSTQPYSTLDHDCSDQPSKNPESVLEDRAIAFVLQVIGLNAIAPKT